MGEVFRLFADNLNRVLVRANRAVRAEPDDHAAPHVGGLEIELTIDPEKHPVSIDGFRIETPLRNFEQAVQVQRRDEAGAWIPVGDDTLLFDYAQYMDTRQLDVTLPKAQRFPAGGTWRITVDEPTIEQQSTLSEVVRTLEGNAETSRKEKTIVERQPFRIDSIQAWHTDEAAEVKAADGIEMPIAAFRVEEEPKEKRTRVRVTSGREPITALRLSVADRNFGRPARVEAPQPATRNRDVGARPPPILGTARVHRIDLRGISSEALAITIPESRYADYEIVIDNADSPPLDITGVTAVGPAYEVVFLARPGKAYRLAYGVGSTDDRLFAAPQYDTVPQPLQRWAGPVVRHVLHCADMDGQGGGGGAEDGGTRGPRLRLWHPTSSDSVTAQHPVGRTPHGRM